MDLFYCFMDEYHQVRFDNLYMYEKFYVGLFNHLKKVIIKGVSRTSSRGVPTEILQKEVTTKESINAVKVTVKACVLEGITDLATCPLVLISIYDKNPVHFLSMFCDNINWIEKTRRTWDK